MALTYATMGAIVKASEQSRKPVPVVLSGESIPRPGDLGTVEQQYVRRVGLMVLDTGFSLLVVTGSNPVRGTGSSL